MFNLKENKKNTGKKLIEFNSIVNIKIISALFSDKHGYSITAD